MVNSFEVGAVFKIIDKASPALQKILKQVRDISIAVDKARASLASLSQLSMPALAGSTKEAAALARAWNRVALNSATATRNMNTAASAATRAAVAGKGITAPLVVRRTGGGGGGGGGGPRGGWWSGKGPHYSRLNAPIPGGHVSFAGNMGTGAAAALGVGVYHEMEMQDALTQLFYHTGTATNPQNIKQYRDILQRVRESTGFPLKDVLDSSLDVARQTVGTKANNNPEFMEEIMKLSGTEARLKGTSLPESVKAMLGMAHMLGANTPEEIRKLAPSFAFLSSASPATLGQIEGTASYAVPELNALGYDPTQVLLTQLALRGAGVTSTKGGTWTKQFGKRLIPGSQMFDKPKDYAEHQRFMKAGGLIDAQGIATYLDAAGKPDMIAAAKILHDHLVKMKPKDANALINHFLGERGGAAYSVMTGKGIMERIAALDEQMKDPKFAEKVKQFNENYANESPLQQARTTLAKFDDVLSDLASHVLPALTKFLDSANKVLDFVKSKLPADVGGDRDGSAAKVGAAAMGGAIAGGLTGGLPGAVKGAVIAGGVEVGREIVQNAADASNASWGKGAKPIPGMGMGTGSISDAINGRSQITGALGSTGDVMSVADAFMKVGTEAKSAYPILDGFGGIVMENGQAARAATTGFAGLLNMLRAFWDRGRGGGSGGPDGGYAPMNFQPRGGSRSPSVTVINHIDGPGLTRNVIKTVVRDSQAIHGGNAPDHVVINPSTASTNVYGI